MEVISLEAKLSGPVSLLTQYLLTSTLIFLEAMDVIKKHLKFLLIFNNFCYPNYTCGLLVIRYLSDY